MIASGGSTTFCDNLETDRAWPLRLQENLRAKPVYVIVGGLPEVGCNAQLLRYSRLGPKPRARWAPW